MFELLGDSPRYAKKEADTVMRIETGLAKASLTRVERRDPYKITHKMKVAELNKLAPNFDWTAISPPARCRIRDSECRVAGISQRSERAIDFDFAGRLEELSALPRCELARRPICRPPS